jgi:uncharacterized membrane protein YbaN (DUF454 family)
MAGCWRIPGLAPILDWQQYRGIRRHARCRAIIFILISFSVSLLVVPLPWVRWLLVVIMVILLTWLMRLPVLEPVAMESEIPKLSRQ